MRSANRQLVERLAAEYVLGTLSGEEREHAEAYERHRLAMMSRRGEKEIPSVQE